MSNDIPRDLIKCVNVSNLKSMPQKSMNAGADALEDKNGAKSMECLCAMGEAKVKMDNSALAKNVRDSVEYFKANPIEAQAHVDFCDALVQKGQSLEKAIDTTDVIFKCLKDETVYKN